MMFGSKSESTNENSLDFDKRPALLIKYVKRLDKELFEGDDNSQLIKGSRVFGTQISKQIDVGNRRLPPLLTKLYNYILENALQIKGLFRLPCSKISVIQLAKKLEEDPNYDVPSTESPAVVARCFMRFFCCLTDTILSRELVISFCNAANSPSDLITFIPYLPEPNSILLEKLLGLLHLLSLNQDINKATPKFLGATFGVALSHPKQCLPEQRRALWSKMGDVLTTMVENLDKFYPATYGDNIHKMYNGLEIPKQLPGTLDSNNNSSSSSTSSGGNMSRSGSMVSNLTASKSKYLDDYTMEELTDAFLDESDN